jgi:hypothetical protein
MEASWTSEDHSPENCPGCRPVVFELGTQKVNKLLTGLAEKAWGQTTPGQRKAWHRVTCLNSREAADQILAQGVMQLIEREFKAAE